MSMILALSTHARFACRHSGACCRAGWDIPMEEPAARAAQGFNPRGIWTHGDLPSGCAAIAARDDRGECVFHRHSRCALQVAGGAEAMPESCRVFPRIATVRPDGVVVTLSHFCPTAASMLFDEREIRIVHVPALFPHPPEAANLDARELLPPLLRPGVMMTWDDFTRWELRVIETLNSATSPESALASLDALALRLQSWDAAHGELSGHVSRCLESRPEPDNITPLDGPSVWRRIHASVPEPIRPLLGLAPPPGPALIDADRRWVAPHWDRWSVPFRRFAASHLFANPLVIQAASLRAGLRAGLIALAVLRAHAAALGAEAQCPLDLPLLREAIRQSDLLLRHAADQRAILSLVNETECAPIRRHSRS